MPRLALIHPLCSVIVQLAMPAKWLPFIKCNDAEFQVPYFLIGFYNYTRIIVGRNDSSGPDLMAKNWFCSSCWQMLCQLRMTDYETQARLLPAMYFLIFDTLSLLKWSTHYLNRSTFLQVCWPLSVTPMLYQEMFVITKISHICIMVLIPENSPLNGTG